jgi:glycosyltransferase involved in cell wall biosynthesis
VDDLRGNPRVLHVLAPGREGGLEQVVAMMSAGQRTKGVHVVAVLTPGEADGHPFVARLEELGVPVTAVVVAARSYVKEYRQLGALITRIKPQLVHTHGYRADVIAGALARARHIPTVSTVHGFTGGGRRNRVYERLQLLMLRRANAVIAVSKPLVKNLADAGISRAKIHCVPNAFTPPVTSLARSAARERLGLARDKLVVGWVGRLSREKGADVMLDALAQSDASWHLSIIGNGPERDALQQQARILAVSDRITWHGLVENAGSLLTAFDAFVLSSRTEGTPITLFEAMHSRVPIIATRVGGIPDVVNPSNAILVPSEQPDTIGRALAEIVNEPSAAAHRSDLARQRLLQSFGAAGWLDAIDAVYEVAGASRP